MSRNLKELSECENCNGDGYTDTEEDCGLCEGTGFVIYLN